MRIPANPTTGLRQYLKTEFWIEAAAAAMMAMGVQVFTAPNFIVGGGLSGIASVLFNVFGWPIGVVTFSLNLPLLLIGWQAAAMKVNAAYIIPSPTQILTRLWELRVPLFTVHLPATMLVTAVGLLISLLLGLTLAVVMDAFPLARKSLYPIIIASQTIPTTAIAPLFVLWFGYTIWSKVLVTVLTVYDGFQSAKTEMEELLCAYGATRIQIFCKLKIPTALPYFFSAIKMAIPMSIIGAAIGEWLGAQSGLGCFSRRMMTQLDGAGVFAPTVLLSAVAMLLAAVAALVERAVIRWRGEL